MAGAFHYELVVVRTAPRQRDNPVLVYLTDHAGTKIPSAGASGTVTCSPASEGDRQSGS